jgi:hypothetical protein
VHTTFSPALLTGRLAKPKSKWQDNINVVLKAVGSTVVNKVLNIHVP